jgi:16S rRNA (cytosine967-C5)-methyltransferase
MTPGARVAAAIEVLSDIIARRRPAPDALKDWGLAHRFAGSGDRAAIASHVYAALRSKSSASWIMQDETPRAIVLGSLRLQDALSVEHIARLCDGSRFASAPLTENERERLAKATLDDAPAHVHGDYPEWLDPHFGAVFGDDRAAEGRALATRAPIDLRVNALKAQAADVVTALSLYAPAPAPAPWSLTGLRIEQVPGSRSPALHVEPCFLKGAFEIQDEGSQIAALLAAAQPGEQVVDLCAGAGGKTLALAAAMDNRGQIFATDLDKRRLAPIYARIERAGVRNTQVVSPERDGSHLAVMKGHADLVVVDAPCTGTGAWRRNPDAKWRVRPGSLQQRLQEQRQVLDQAAALVKPGGRVAYITCSVLDEENGAQVRAFAERHPGFSLRASAALLAPLGDRAEAFAQQALLSQEGVLMTPRRTNTDGFFVAVLSRAS